jgi:hypothetical protein
MATRDGDLQIATANRRTTQTFSLVFPANPVYPAAEAVASAARPQRASDALPAPRLKETLAVPPKPKYFSRNLNLL